AITTVLRRQERQPRTTEPHACQHLAPAATGAMRVLRTRQEDRIDTWPIDGGRAKPMVLN
ncbi:mCG146183, partial [Mus musculus]